MQPSQQPSAYEAVALFLGEESSDLLATLPGQIPSVEPVGASLPSHEDLPTAAAFPTEVEVRVQGVIPGSSQDEAGPEDEVGDD